MTNHHQSSSGTKLSTTAPPQSSSSSVNINSLLISTMSNLTSLNNANSTSASSSSTNANATSNGNGSGGNVQQQQQQSGSNLVQTLLENSGATGSNKANLLNNNTTTTTTSSTTTVAATSNTALIDLVICKLVSPYHIINDPRLLDCGASACYNCILGVAKEGQAVKCPYCQQMHKLPNDPNKLASNRNLQTFLKINLSQLNQNFTKQLEDSMFALERNFCEFFCCCSETGQNLLRNVVRSFCFFKY
jgi:hypothetical protein